MRLVRSRFVRRCAWGPRSSFVHGPYGVRTSLQDPTERSVRTRFVRRSYKLAGAYRGLGSYTVHTRFEPRCGRGRASVRTRFVRRCGWVRAARSYTVRTVFVRACRTPPSARFVHGSYGNSRRALTATRPRADRRAQTATRPRADRRARQPSRAPPPRRQPSRAPTAAAPTVPLADRRAHYPSRAPTVPRAHRRAPPATAPTAARDHR